MISIDIPLFPHIDHESLTLPPVCSRSAYLCACMKYLVALTA